MSRAWLWLAAAVLLIAGVNARPFDMMGNTVSRAHNNKFGLFEKAWGNNDVKTFTQLGVTNYNLASLPKQGTASRPPWPGSYWPCYEDGINFRWAGVDTMSPASKYARAFLTNPQMTPTQITNTMQGFEDAISKSKGVESGSDVCTQDAQCGGNKCGRRTRVGETTPQSSGFCVEGWAGICDGWSPAAVAEPEPKRTVYFNGVPFLVADLKALLSMSYTSTRVVFAGNRCIYTDAEIPKDSTGRPKDASCRDVNPGAWHVVVASMLGSGKSLVEERTWDLQVWNQPIFGFTSTISDITFAQAHKKLGLSQSTRTDKYYYNNNTASLKVVQMTLTYVRECNSDVSQPVAGQYTTAEDYEYLLELDAAGNVIGGEWSTDNFKRHPDTLWSSIDVQPLTGLPMLKLTDVQWLNSLTQLDPNSNVCATNNGGCDSNAACSSMVQSGSLSVACVCNRGFKGTGRYCEADDTPPVDNKCATNNGGCPAASTCSQDSTGAVQCTCPSGLFWNAAVQPSRCDDVNECATNNGGCAQVCTNLDRTFSCSCRTGYKPVDQTCVDIDECAVTPNICNDQNSKCYNLPGSYDCPCVSGFSRRTADSPCTPNVNPPFNNCSDPNSNTCDPLTTFCRDLPNGRYKCECAPGLILYLNQATGKNYCAPQNACQINNGGCHAQAACTPLDNGTALCTCQPGLLGDGHLCYPENQRPTPLDLSKCSFAGTSCPIVDVSNTTVYSEMREEQHVSVLFRQFVMARTRTVAARLPLECQLTCILPLTPGWTVNLITASLTGTVTLMPASSLRGYVEMWLTGQVPSAPAMKILVANQGPATAYDQKFVARRDADPAEATMQGTCDESKQVLLRAWMTLQMTGPAGSSISINSINPATSNYDTEGQGFDWAMEWKKC